ncbi:MAG: PspC domain-containing protein [Bacteroidales bacterium]|nr:PspC domain-containing protein [Bacteroidales bacterium]
MEKKLFKSKNKKVSGVLGGLANYFDIDPTIVRVAYILLTIFTGFFPGLIAYVVMALVIPAEEN